MDTHIFMVFCLVILNVFIKISSARDYRLSVIHINDFHARFEQISETLGPCKYEATCVGGFPRLFSAVKQLKQEHPQSIFLNAGDNYQGTLYFNVFRWNITQHFMNFLPIDAMTFGNHEFDDSIEGIVPFLKTIKFPVVACNINDSLEPELQGLYNKSIVVERNGKKIGIIGVVLHLYKELSNTRNLTFLDEAESINSEAERLSKEQGVFTNIVVSHCGYDVDKVTASKLSEKVSLIVGGHSHTLLHSGIPPSNEKPIGPYPTLVSSKDNTTILIVQASAFTQYLGNISINYNENGQITAWKGSPIYLNHKIPEDKLMLEELKPWQSKLEIYTQTYGETKVTLDISNCFREECNIGNFVTDAMIDTWKNKAENGSWSYASIALVNSGSIKSNIEIGNITYQDLLTCLPWNNTFDVIKLSGADIKKVLDFATRTHYYDSKSNNRYLLQVSGVQVVYNVTQPLGSRIISVDVLCQDCAKPVYEPLLDDKIYKVVTSSYLLLGRDSFYAIKDKLQFFEPGPLDVSSLIEYVKKYSPLQNKQEERIIFKS